MTTTTDDELLKLAEDATPGPWEADGTAVGVPGKNWGVSWPPRDGTIASLDDGEYIENPNAVADAAFIAAASPDRVRALVLRVQRAEEALAAIRNKAEGRNDNGWQSASDGYSAGLLDAAKISRAYFDTTKEGE